MTPSDNLQKIKHIVVLMLENRSFDHMLGWLYDGESPPRGQQFEGLRRDLWNPLQNVDADGVPFVEQVFVRKNGEGLGTARFAPRTVPVRYDLPNPDPGEGFRATNHQLFGSYDVALLYPVRPSNTGFVNDYHDANLFNTYCYGEACSDPRDIMICYTPEQVPVLSALAKQFAVCDHWHASVPSQTLANRHFVHAATSGGMVNNAPHADCSAPTIFNVIQDAIHAGRTDLSWTIYGGVSDGKFFSMTRLVMPKLQSPDLDANFVALDQFYIDAKSGALPSYAFLEPQFHTPGANDQHPPADIRAGEQLIADVYCALLASPQWNETLFVITYDEHGGCYDHVPPPGATPPDASRPTGQDGFLFNRFGVRVPAVLVSPWIEAGAVCRPAGYAPFDHTSVIATITRRFGLQNLTERDKAAPDLGCALTLSAPRTDQPQVQPLALPPALTEQVNDLHRLMAEILQHYTGLQQPTDDQIFDYIHSAYQTYMAGKRTAAAAAGAGK
jgi:phospholipase C